MIEDTFIKELESMIENDVVLSKDDIIASEDLVHAIQMHTKKQEEEGLSIYLLPYNIAKEKLIESFTYNYLKNRLKANKGNVTKAAQESGLLRQGLQQIMRKYNIKSSDFKED